MPGEVQREGCDRKTTRKPNGGVIKSGHHREGRVGSQRDTSERGRAAEASGVVEVEQTGLGGGVGNRESGECRPSEGLGGCVHFRN